MRYVYALRLAKLRNIFQTTKYVVHLHCHNTKLNMVGYIYKTTNKLNGWIYIGQHKCSAFDTAYKGSGKILTEAFAIYGKENFETEVICWAESLEQLNDLENVWISAYRSEDCYNVAGGGNGGAAYIYVDLETKLIYLSSKSASMSIGVHQTTFLKWVNRNGKSNGFNSDILHKPNAKNVRKNKNSLISLRWVMLPSCFLLRMKNPKFA